MSDLANALQALRAQAERDLEIAGKATEVPWVRRSEKSRSIDAPAKQKTYPDGSKSSFLTLWGHPEETGEPIRADVDFIIHTRSALPASAQTVLRLCGALELAIKHRTGAADLGGLSEYDDCSDMEILAALNGDGK